MGFSHFQSQLFKATGTNCQNFNQSGTATLSACSPLSYFDCFSKATLAELTDEAIDLFEQCLGEAYRRSKTSLKKHRERVAKSTNNKVRWFNVLASLIIDDDVADNAIRKLVYQKITKERLEEELKESNQLYPA